MSVEQPLGGERLAASPQRHSLQARPTYRLVVIVCAIVIAGVLYYWMGRNDPLPMWVSLPPGSSVLVSRYKPAGEAEGRVLVGNVRQAQYYLQVRCQSGPQDALLQWMPCLSGFTWENTTPRQTKVADSFVRAGWPEWVRKSSYHAQDVQAGFTLSSSSPPTRLYLYAWPVDGGCVVELVVEDDLSTANHTAEGN